jgi:hypothetical protein
MAGPIDYRQLQNPVDPMGADSLPGSGKAGLAGELSNAFQQFQGVTKNVADKANVQAGSLAGAAAGATGTPGYKEGLTRFTAYSQAYNNAATGAYLMESETHAEQTASQLLVAANKNPDTFQATYSAARDATLKAAPAMAQPELMRLWNKHLADGVATLSGQQASELQQTQRDTYDKDVERSISRVALLQGSPNTQDQLQGLDEHAKLIAKITGGVTAGLYSVAEGQAKQINAIREVTGQVFETQLDRELGRMGETGDSGDVVKLLDNFRKAHEDNLADPKQPAALSEPEFNQLYQLGKTKLMQQNMQDMYNRRTMKTAAEQKLEDGDRTITVAMATPGGADPVKMRQMVQDMVHTGDLKPEVGRAVLGSIARGQDAPVNMKGMFDAENNPNRFDWKPADIASMVDRGDINYKQAIELTQKIETQRQGWEGHAPIRDARAFVTAALKLPSGIALETASDETKKSATNAQVELTRQLSALPVDKRDGEAPRIASNVALEMQARAAEAKAAALQNQRAYLDKTYGPGGTSYTNDADYAARKAHLDEISKAAQAQAAQLRSGIK